MSNAVQSSTESQHDFVVRSLNMRENVLILVKEEGCRFIKIYFNDVFFTPFRLV